MLRVRIAFLVVLVFSGLVIWRIGRLQFSEGDRWRSMAEDMGLQYRTIKATRGNIYSDNGSLLATSLPFYRLSFDPLILNQRTFEEEIDSLSLLLARFYKDESAAHYKEKIIRARKEGKRYLNLNREMIGYQDKKTMEDWPVFRYGRMNGGVIFEKIDKRFRPFNYLAFRTVGFLNEDNYGAGLEYSFNKQLAGRNGEALYQKMAGGNWKPVHHSQEVRPENGLDIETTIDINLQDVAESALLHALKENQADMGCVIVMEVKTGEIKAISNLKRNSKGLYGEAYNYAVGEQGLREPGSTFKLATYMALLEETKLKLTDSIKTGNGEFKFYTETVRDHKPGGYGTITIKDAFEKSSNIAIAKLIDETFKKNPQRFMDYLNNFGVTFPLGFQMVGEGKPKFPPVNEFSGITLPWMAYGYGLEMTPLQTLTLYNAVANNGTMIRPIIVRSAKRADKTIERYKTSVVTEKICSKQTLDMLRTMLEGVVENGTANNIKGTSYKIAGKTGTAQILRNGKHVREYYTSFAGYFPAENPKYSCIVVIDNPKGYRQYGSDVAAPVFKEIADKIYSLDLRMHSPMVWDGYVPTGVFPLIQAGHKEELRYICNRLGISNHATSDDAEWVRTRVNQNSIDWTPNEVSMGKVPNVAGMTLRDALYLLENAGLKVKIVGSGRVKQQSQYPGNNALKGSEITITLG